MHFISPFHSEENARIAGRQSLSELIANIRCTILEIVVDSEEAHSRLLALTLDNTEPVEPVEIDSMATANSEHANMLVNIVIALDEYRQCKSEQAVHDLIIGSDSHE